jgi:subtilisin family serine protease
MTIVVAPDLPWEPERTRLAMRGRVLVRLRAGEDPEHVPYHRDVHEGRSTAHASLDGGGEIDRTMSEFSHAVRITRAFSSARGGPGERHQAWDDVERSIGFSRTFRVEVDPEGSILGLVDSLQSLAHVEMATPYYLSSTPFAHPHARASHVVVSEHGEHYGHRMVGAEEALRFEPGDSALIVGLIDSGVAMHPELIGALRPGLETVELSNERVSRGVRILPELAETPRDFRDRVGHGTACAGIIRANGDRLPRGLAGAARLLAVRALAAAEMVEQRRITAIGALCDIDDGVKAAIDLGARVLNLSFGTPESALRPADPVPHAEVVSYALARDCVLVAASGNSGEAERYFPAALPGVIAVGAVGPDRTPTSFTTRGEHVAVCAPGEKLQTAALDGGYKVASGTSFAAPYVTGACALIVAHASRYSTHLSPAAVRALLVENTAPFAAGADARGCGSGILDVPAALRAASRMFLDREREHRAVELNHLARRPRDVVPEGVRS